METEPLIDPEMMEEARKHFAARAAEKYDIKEDKSEGWFCHFCKKALTRKDKMYCCVFHQNIFCEACATQKGDFNRSEGKFARCVETKVIPKDCIWEKVI